jgi:hypothetical protein
MTISTIYISWLDAVGGRSIYICWMGISHRQSPSAKAWKCGEFPAPRAHTLRVGNYLVIYSITTGEQQSCKLHVSIIRYLITPGSMIQNRQSLRTNQVSAQLELEIDNLGKPDLDQTPNSMFYFCVELEPRQFQFIFQKWNWRFFNTGLYQDLMTWHS